MTAQQAFAKVHIDPFEGIDEQVEVKNDPILVADGITRRFGGLTAVNVEHCEVQRGAITALIGLNGAGKTTFFNLVTGFDHPNSGTWSFEGEPLDGLTSYKIARRGHGAHVPAHQVARPADRARQHEAGCHRADGRGLLPGSRPARERDQEAEVTEQADALLGRFNLAHMRDEFAGELSAAQAARDGPGPDGQAPPADARRAHGRREPCAWPRRSSAMCSSCARTA